MSRPFDAPTRLRAAIADAEPALRNIPGHIASTSIAAGVWSVAELIGHLIDSASNNHQRFVRARWQDSLVFTGYAQTDWVSAQRYDTAEWNDLISLWASFNRHLAHVMETTPPEVRNRIHTAHNLDAISFRPPTHPEDATLASFMADYVAHLEFHLQQIFEPGGRLAQARQIAGAMP